MNKIFGIGLTKTATTSLHDAMTILGYSSVHYSVNPDYDVHYNDFICDMPMQTRFNFYDNRYPDSKFILTIRNIDSWLDSCEKWIVNRPVAKHSVTGLYRTELYGTHIFDRQIFIETYHKHHDRINSYFHNRQNDLLIIDICKEPSWEKLCYFLDKPIPQTPFPHSNKNEQRLCNDG